MSFANRQRRLAAADRERAVAATNQREREDRKRDSRAMALVERTDEVLGPPAPSAILAKKDREPSEFMKRQWKHRMDFVYRGRKA